MEINTSFLDSVSPLKRKNLIREKSIENYVKKKKKKYFQHCLMPSKLNNVYDVSIKANESSPRCCIEWVKNIGLACKSVLRYQKK